MKKLLPLLAQCALFTGCGLRNPDDVKLEKDLRAQIAKLTPYKDSWDAEQRIKAERWQRIVADNGDVTMVDTHSLAYDSLGVYMWARHSDGSRSRTLFDCARRVSKMVGLEINGVEHLDFNLARLATWIIINPESVGEVQLDTACRKK